ncbi:MAG: type II toxin-antitoxin system Phd/YefM family antitoxin [Deltaproteobacteria bacterium]|nr:type II toxin-antitoxin system Phd/YefM family antitoxin [Deltaproteobacteria bacterium]
MLIDTEKMIPITRLQRELTLRLKEVSETGEPVYVLRNNKMAAVIISSEEYELLKNVEELLEHLEISEVIEQRLKRPVCPKNIPWEKIKKKHSQKKYRLVYRLIGKHSEVIEIVGIGKSDKEAVYKMVFERLKKFS